MKVSAGYRLVQVLGEGGMGTVYRAEPEAGGPAVAIKLLKRNDDEDARRRFLREAKAATAIRHPNVVRVLDVLEIDGAPALVMELLEGESLARRLEREGVLPLAALAKILLPVCDALEAAHALGIVHRDLKPENVFLVAGEPEVVKVVDFGIAKLTSLDGEAQRTTGLTATGAVLGTPSYMSPEQIFGERDVDARADVWALGIITYECVSGVLPTAGSNVGQILKNILTRPIWPLAETAPSLPLDVSSLCDRMLERDRSKRLSDLEEVRAVFRAYLGSTTPAVRAVPKVHDESAALFGAGGRRVDPEVGTLEGRTDREAVSTIERAPTITDLVLATPKREPRRLRAFGLAAVALLALGGGGYAAQLAGAGLPSSVAHAQPSAKAPLSSADEVLACPVFEASGVEAPSSWLGAAAADLACRRATWMLGGSSSRTRTPAELLDAPRQPSSSAMREPFDEDARSKTLAAAETRAQVILDGRVARIGRSFDVTLKLTSKKGEALGAATARRPLLPAAVQAALDELSRSGALPLAKSLDAKVQSITFLPDPAAGLAAEEISLKASDLKAPCEALLSRELSRPWWPLIAPLCEVHDQRARATLDRSTPYALAFSAMSMVRSEPGEKLPGVLDELARARRAETSGQGQAALALAEADVAFNLQETERARTAVLASLAADPRPRDAWELCSEILAARREPSSATEAATWSPGSADAWEELLSDATDTGRLQRFGLRAHALSDHPRALACSVGDGLARAGVLEPVRSMIAELEDDPGGVSARAFLKGRIDLAQDKPFAAYEGWKASSLGLAAIDDAASYYLTLYAVRLAPLYGEKRSYADAWARRYLSRGSVRVDLSKAENARLSVAVCSDATPEVAKDCYAAIEERKGAIRGWSPDLDDLLHGAEAWSRGDPRAAAAAWRGLIASSHRVLPAEVFEAAHEPEIAKACDERALASGQVLHGLSTTTPWAALRARRRGDTARARELAKAVLDAWSVTDAPIPVLTEMRSLLLTTK